jgi:ATP-dependent NAD(P)H-hydrate dehydratase
MSQATKEILLKVRKMVPPMLEKFHKGMPAQNRSD